MRKRVGIYLRVSTDGQTTQNQRRELEAVADRSGWEVVGVYEDATTPRPARSIWLPPGQWIGSAAAFSIWLAS